MLELTSLQETIKEPGPDGVIHLAEGSKVVAFAELGDQKKTS